jgi:hypothetical protein
MNGTVSTPTQPYADASGEYEDPALQEALAQSKQYTRDRYVNGEPSSATYAAYSMSPLYQKIFRGANNKYRSTR